MLHVCIIQSIYNNHHVHSCVFFFLILGCGHCKRLKPIYSEVSRTLKNDPKLTEVPVVLAKVDATKEKALAEKYRIQAFPTLKYFRSNAVFDFEGSFQDANCKKSNKISMIK